MSSALTAMDVRTKDALSEHLILGLTVLAAVGASLLVPGFATWWNVQTMLLYGLPLLLVATGLTLVLITGGIDLSVTSIMALVSVLGAWLMTSENGAPSAGVPVALAGMLAAGVGVGLVNGVCVSAFRIPAFIATLIVMMVAGGFAVWFTRSDKIAGLPGSFLLIGQNLWVAGLIVAVLVAGAHVLLSRCRYGQWLYLVGLNVKAAEIAGVPVVRTLRWVYGLSGLYAAAGAVLLTASLETGDPVMARNSLLDVVGATVLGGTSLQGGRGKVLWTVYGVAFLVLLGNCLNLLNVHYYFITLTKGGVILLAAVIDARRNR